MARAVTIPENFMICAGFAQIDSAGVQAGGDWINLENHSLATCVIVVNDGSSAAPTVSFDQAQDSAAGGVKDLDADGGVGITEFWYKSHATSLLSATTFTKVEQAENDVVTFPDTGTAIVVVPIRANQLDMANGFTHIQADWNVSVGTPHVSVLWFLSGTRYGQAVIASAQ